MTCRDVAQLLDAFVDAELPGPMLVAVARHAAGCASCDASVRQLIATHEAVERAVRQDADDLDLSGVWAGVEQSIAHVETRRAWRHRLRGAPMWGAAAAIAAASLFWVRTVPEPTPTPTRVAARPRPNQTVIERIDSEAARLELRRERKYGTTLIMVSAEGTGQ
jgi:anti-sigma factor RsiW